ncbi:MAG TPA: D-xylose ABC transporter ATP-binding protein, partial [Lachnospiraceae bacterium]|nr:D-xylose ABC transporter ATP-binding protein [Lachnospiraceae bacterium]
FGQYDKGVTKEVYLKGQKIEIHKPLDAIRNGIGMITEERKLTGMVPMLSIRENISLASLPELSGKIFMNEKEEKSKVKEIYDSLRIKAPSMETKMYTLSGGNQQKTILGKWLLNDPEILFVDEPTKGIDVGTKADFYTLLGELAARDVAIVMVSSDMPELISMSDRCIVLSEGRLTAELKKGEITETAVMSAAIA